MLVETLLAVGAWSAAITSGISAAAFAVNWYKYAKSEWAKATGISFLKHCYKKHLQLNKALKRGYAGEHALAKQLDKVRGKKKVLYNVLIPSGPNGTTEIDALMIHETGVYVFENKNYSGTIGCFQKGKNNQIELANIKADVEKWGIIYNSGVKKEMYNPVLQNETHVYFVKKLLDHLKIGQQRFFSYITFDENCKVKGAPLNYNFSCDGKMLMLRHLTDDLNSKINQRSTILTPRTMDAVVSVFEPFSCCSEEERSEHIKRVRQRVSEQAAEELADAAELKGCEPLSDVIRSAAAKVPEKDDRQDNAPLKNYMNMFRS